MSDGKERKPIEDHDPMGPLFPPSEDHPKDIEEKYRKDTPAPSSESEEGDTVAEMIMNSLKTNPDSLIYIFLALGLLVVWQRYRTVHA